jgi:glycosyltransferase involved in cell wall biosynthesis
VLNLLLLMERCVTGGAERRFLRLARHLPRDRFDIRIGVLEPGGDLADDFAATGLPIVPFHRRWRFDLSPVARLARYCRDEDIAVIHAMHWLSGTFAALAARQAPQTAALGSTVQLYYDAARFGPVKALSDRWLARYLSAMVVNTPHLREYLIRHGFPAAKIEVIPNGVAVPNLAAAPTLRAAIRARYRIPQDAPCVGMLARLHANKDHATFLRAAQIVRGSLPAARIVIAGAGGERDRLVALAGELGLSDQTIFTGNVAGGEAILPAWDVAALSSTYEGLPNAILEALAWGVPVVATRVSGVPDIVADGVNGYLVPVGDAPALATGMLRLLDDPARAGAMGARGRAMIAADWSLERMVDRYATLYLRCHADKPARREQPPRR